ncbi:hypothetical protein H4S02_008038, partial [Coemansia sp. RSA 2611]
RCISSAGYLMAASCFRSSRPDFSTTLHTSRSPSSPRFRCSRRTARARPRTIRHGPLPNNRHLHCSAKRTA